MTISRSFDAMLTEKLHPELLKNEIVDRTYILKKAEMDKSWKGGRYGFAFQESGYTSVAFDGYTAENDVDEAAVARGYIESPQVLTGTMKFNHRDLIEHNSNKITEASFLKILPSAITDFAMTFKNVLACNLLIGKVFAVATADGEASGKIQVSRVDRFRVGMKIEVESDSQPLTAYYVTKVSIQNKDDLFVVLSSSRGGAGADLSLLLAADNVKFYHPNGKAKGFKSLKELLGIDTNMWGLDRNDYSYLQTMVLDGSVMSATNILDVIFDYVTELRIATASEADEVLMSLRNFGHVIKGLEGEKKAFNVIPNSRKVNKFGWQTIEIGSVTGEFIKITGIQEMDDDFMAMVNMNDFTFATNGFIRQVKTPEGLSYYTVRSATGYSYLLDWEVYGEFFCKAPNKQGYIKDISIS